MLFCYEAFEAKRSGLIRDIVYHTLNNFVLDKRYTLKVYFIRLYLMVIMEPSNVGSTGHYVRGLTSTLVPSTLVLVAV